MRQAFRRLFPIDADSSNQSPAPRWVGVLFLLLAIALVPWIVYIYATLPRFTEMVHYRVAWVGFDIALLVLMALTAVLALQGKRQMELPAVALATLLIVDAWFDITTASGKMARTEAIILAIFVELPIAGSALYLSRRVERSREAALNRAIEDNPRLKRRLTASQEAAMPDRDEVDRESA